MQEIPYGYCHCGCGRKTSIAKYTLHAAGWKKGEPVNFIQGHKHPRTTEEKFWNTANKTAENGCWEWQGYGVRGGYGLIMYRSKKWLAHRLSWTLTHGAIPADLLVLHKCDNPKCINPDHLFIGTDKDNSDDMWQKGRAVVHRGENNGQSKLTREQVQTIRQLYSDKAITLLAAAQRYGVCQSTVHNIVKNKVWVPHE